MYVLILIALFLYNSQKYKNVSNSSYINGKEVWEMRKFCFLFKKLYLGKITCFVVKNTWQCLWYILLEISESIAMIFKISIVHCRYEIKMNKTEFYVQYTICLYNKCVFFKNPKPTKYN